MGEKMQTDNPRNVQLKATMTDVNLTRIRDDTCFGRRLNVKTEELGVGKIAA